MNRHLLASLHKEYTQQGLSEQDVPLEPIAQFQRWLKDAISAGLREPNAMTLATVSARGAPSTRIILLKDFGPDGFVFFTNYESSKAHDLVSNPRASLLFHWIDLERQVRVDGTTQKTTRKESEAYFHSRPRESQIGAWTSPQSHIIPDRAFLEKKFSELKAHYEGKSISCPPQWGGFRLIPETIEFWQGRANRLHDRLQFIRQEGRWVLHRLAP